MFQHTVWILFLFAVQYATSSHIMEGPIQFGGHLETSEGAQPYWCEADVKMPTVAWEDLCPKNCDDVRVQFCNPKYITLSGNLDSDDFKEGVVLSFADVDYASVGCPSPPRMIAGRKQDEVIFREILSVQIRKNGRITLKTKFVAGEKVVPEVMIHVGDVGPSSVRLLETGRTVGEVYGTNLNVTTRTGVLGVNDFGRSGSVTIGQSTQTILEYRFSISAGVCDFDFSRSRLRATWLTRMDADAEVTVRTVRSFDASLSRELLNIPIPQLSFSQRIRFVGTVRLGLFVRLNYEAKLALSASLGLTVKGSYSLGHKFEISLRGAEVTSPTGRGFSASGQALASGTVSAEAGISGLVGIRPMLVAEATLPIIPDAAADIGATVGVQASITGKTPAFEPVTQGNRIGVCDECHSLQGSIDFVGVDFGSNVKAPFFRERFFSLDEELFSLNIGTVCLLETTCRVPTVII